MAGTTIINTNNNLTRTPEGGINSPGVRTEDQVRKFALFVADGQDTRFAPDLHGLDGGFSEESARSLAQGPRRK